MDALKQGFTVYLLADAIRGVSYPADSVEAALAAMKTAGIQYIV
jgi:nicotinamidase-related amidase